MIQIDQDNHIREVSFSFCLDSWSLIQRRIHGQTNSWNTTQPGAANFLAGEIVESWSLAKNTDYMSIQDGA